MEYHFYRIIQMRTLREALILGSALLFAACSQVATPWSTLAQVPSLPQTPTVQDFSDQILTGRATGKANTFIDRLKAEANNETGFLTILGSMSGGAPGAAVGQWLEGQSSAQRLADLEERRLPLAQDLVKAYETRTHVNDGIFSVCVSGEELRFKPIGYQQWSRIESGPGPCPTTSITELPSLKDLYTHPQR